MDVPEIDGATELTGTVFAGPEPTTPVGAEVAEADPTPFVPVTVTSSVEPTSDACTVYVDDVALGIGGPHFVPVESQSDHV